MMGVAIIVSPQSNRTHLVELVLEKEGESYDTTISNKIPTHGVEDSPSALTILREVIAVKNNQMDIKDVWAVGNDYNAKSSDNKNINYHYNMAVKNGDTETAGKLVEEYAKSKGYTEKVYHGTKRFGFTKLDVSQSDDGISFFATPDMDIAQTYSGTDETRKISGNKEYSAEDLLNALLDSGIYSEVDMFEKGNVEDRKWEVQAQFGAFKKALNKRMLESDFEETYSKASQVLVEFNRWFEEGQKNTEEFKKAVDEAKEIRNVVSDYANRLYAAIEIYERTDENMFLLDGMARSEESVRNISTLNGIVNGDNYELYANVDNLLEVDAEGSNWNNIKYYDNEYDRKAEELRRKAIKISTVINSLGEDWSEKEVAQLHNDLEEAITELHKENPKVYSDLKIKETLSIAKEFNEAINNWTDEDEKKAGRNIVDMIAYPSKGQRISTREIAKRTKAQGYEGVKIVNVMDDGGRSIKSQKEPGTVYIFFNPSEQLKSADPITYDDEGNVIPLEERFNNKNDDIRFSKRQNVKTDEYYKKIKPATRIESEKLTMQDDRNIARYRNEIDSSFDGSMKTGQRILLGMPSKILLKNGIKNKPIYMSQDVAMKIVYPENYFKGKHNLGMSVLKNLPFQLCNPIIITKNTAKQNEQNESKVIWTNWKTEKGNSIMAVIRLNKNNEIEIDNSIPTIYDASEKYRKGILDNPENIIYTKNNKDINELLHRRRHMPKGITDDTLIKYNLAKSIDKVNNDPKVLFNLRNTNTELEEENTQLKEEIELKDKQIDLLKKQFEITKGHKPSDETLMKFAKKIQKVNKSSYPLKDLYYS